MKIYFITRFSILTINDNKRKGLRITRNKSYEQYKKELFSPKRLNAKFLLFTKLTYPTILNQKDKNWEWHIYASNELPQPYKNRIKLLCSRDSRIKLFFIKDMSEFNTQKFTGDYATVRLDDDDGLKPDYTRLLQKYKDKKNHVISFQYGIKVGIRNGRLVRQKRIVKRVHIALGLAAINMNIYSFGHHRNLEKDWPILYNNTVIYYLSYGDHTDSGRTYYKN